MKHFVKKLSLCLFLVFCISTTWAQTATLEVSTSTDTPEKQFEMKNGNSLWATSYTSPTKTCPGSFAFFAAEDKTDAYYIYSIMGGKFVSYSLAASYNNGTNKATLVDSQSDAQPWNITSITVSNVTYYQISPYKSDGSVASIYMNWYGGTGSNPLDGETVTVGFYSTDGTSDAGSRWTLVAYETATDEEITAAKALIKEGVGYPKTTSQAYIALNSLETGASSNNISIAKQAYISCTDILLPEDGKAYNISNYCLYNGGTARHLNYTAGAALTVSTECSDASVFVCKELSSGVYAFITEDGKILTWMGGSDGYRTDEKLYGYSTYYGTEYSDYSDWNKITVKKNGTGESDLGYLRMIGRRSASQYSSFIIKGSTGDWDQAGDSYYFQNSDSFFSSAWIFTEVEHSNTEEQTLAIAKIDAKNIVATNTPGEVVCQYHYVINGENVYDAATLNNAIDAATTADEVTAITSSYSINLPETGKYYRIKGISGNYIDAVNCYESGNQMGMKSEAECNYEGTIFYLDSESRFKNVATGTYIYDTRHIGATESNGNKWTFAESTRTKGCITLTSNYSGAKQLHDNNGNRADRCSSICSNRHDFTLEEVSLITLEVDGPSIVGATATWNNETKTIPATFILLSGSTITSPTLSIKCGATYNFDGLTEGDTSLGTTVEISSLDADRTITANFSPAFFSSVYGENWISMTRATNAAHAAILESSETNAIPIFNTIDYANEGILWCFVGTAESFKIYNKVSGEALALTQSNTPANGVTVNMTVSSDAIYWHLIKYENGYAIAPVGNESYGINSYTGNIGSQLKFYGVADDGTHWNFNMMDLSRQLTLSVNIDNVLESSPRVAELTFIVNDIESSTRILGNVEAETFYLPKGATFSLSSMTYRGYTFNGFNGTDSYTDTTLPENGLTLTASYTANDERTLYYTPDANNKPYRIPAIAAAPNGHIFAIADNRPCGNDIGYGEVDIKCRISTDNGNSWGEEFFVADGNGDNSNAMGTGFGDAAIVADRDQNKLLVMMVCGRTVCHNGRWHPNSTETSDNINRVARVYAEFNETSGEWEWTEPEEITNSIYSLFLDENGEPTVTSLFIGSGKICQSRVVKKDKYYRLYCSMWTRDGGNRVIYSDDFGETWNVLGTIADRPAPSGDEPKCEELPDGTVVLSSRKYYGRYFNLFIFSDDTYTTGTWGTVVSSNDITGGLSFGNNSTNGEIYKIPAIRKSDGTICDLMLQSVPTGNGRNNVAIYYKEIDNATTYTPETFATNWTKGIQVSSKNSCYSTMIMQADGRIGFLFEEEPGSYSIVYIPYTIEEITDGNYCLYTVTSTIGSYGIGTFYATEAMSVPNGITAYVATESPEIDGATGGGTITLTEVTGGIIPANTGVILRGEAAEYEFIPSIGYGDRADNNMFIGYEAADNDSEKYKDVTLADGYTTYILSVVDEKAGFYRKSSNFKLYNNKAYLQVPSTSARSLTIRFGNGAGTTLIENVMTDSQPAIIYDLFGRRIESMEKGIYIINGHKVLKN